MTIILEIRADSIAELKAIMAAICCASQPTPTPEPPPDIHFTLGPVREQKASTDG